MATGRRRTSEYILEEKSDEEVFDFLQSLFEDSFVEVEEGEDYSDWIVE